ncbi:thermonuclease family protein [Metabacillus sp. RGM 3146]|uniref:thermonuclease family protein n=1 Tax=Metabacillus sp. RGM 3146 TaxID=3401092 RepID=UPI003B9D1C9D
MKKKWFSLLSVITLSSFLAVGCATQVPSTQQHTETSKEQNSVTSVQSQQEPSKNKKWLPAVIVKNIDGDTVKIKLNGKIETVRMLCVDTPETHHPRLGVQPFGPEASDFTKKTLYEGRSIQIEPGIGGGRDKYGRLLAYIYINNKMFNEMLLEKGLARVAYVYPPNTQYVDQFYAIQKKAQKKAIGIWSIENYAQEDGYHPDGKSQIASRSSGEPGQTSNITGNAQTNSSGDKETNLSCKGKIKGNANSHIYHVPSGEYYNSLHKHIVWFCSAKDAEKAGYRQSKR